MADNAPKEGVLKRLRGSAIGALRGKLWALVSLFVVLGLIGAASLFEKAAGNRIKEKYDSRGGDAPEDKPLTVLAVFPNPDISSVSRPMVDRLGFGSGEQRISLLENVDFERLWEGPTPEITAHRVSERIKRGDVVLVIGHERSTVVEYMNQAVYENLTLPMPLILPAATNPDLTANTGSRRHTLRLPATDAQQVSALTIAIGRLMPRRVTIIRDKSNPVYSTYIGEQLISKLPNVVQSVGLDVDLADTGVPGEVLNGDTVVVAGMENLAKVLLGYVRSHGAHIGHSPRMIFTDGVAGVVFESAAMQILNEGDRIYMSGPFPTDRFKGTRLEKFPNYEPYADLVRNVAFRLLSETKERGPISQQAVLQTLWAWLDDGQSRKFGNTQVTFDPRGDNMLAQTHIFEITTAGTLHSVICSCPMESVVP